MNTVQPIDDKHHASGPDAAEVIAAHLARVRYDDLPASTVAATKACILDTIACALAGTDSVDVAAIVAVATDRAGKPTSTVFNSGGLKVPPEAAVLANGATIHQFDYDDTHDVAVCHPTSASLVPALATAEEVGGVSGRDLITAVALANDLTSRVALGIRGNLSAYPWFRAPVVGIFGATAAVAKIRGASAQQHAEALGLTLPFVSGTLASLHHGGSSVRSIRDGLCYRNGVLAAELAMRGVRGDREVFDGRFGYYQAFYRGEYDRDKLVGGLGERYETDNISLKPWPTIRHLHTSITALVDILTEHKLAFDDVDRVTAFVGKINLDRCRSTRLGMVPKQRIDLLGNLPFALGATLLHGGPMLALYRKAELADEVITRAVPRIRWEYDKQQDGPWTFESGRIEVATRKGEKFTATCKTALGNPNRPMSSAQRHQKMLDGAANAAHPVAEARARQIIDTVERLEEMKDVSALAALLA